MDLGIDMKEELVWCEETESTSFENLEPVSEIISVKDEVKSELTVPGRTQENAFEPSADVKGEVFIEQQTIDELLPHIKEENKSRPGVSHGDHPPSLEQVGFRCEHCSKNFRHKRTLLGHMSTHTGEKPFLCTICGKSFSQYGSLVRHKHEHTGLKPHKCSVCSKSFFRKSDLQGHMRVHTGERPYKCEVCGKRYSSSKALSYHSLTHTGERPYKCKECGRSFRQSSSLTYHMRIHQPYKCAICSKMYTKKIDLSIHRISHIGE